MILVDSNVAIDALDTASSFHAWAIDALRRALPYGMFFNHIIVAELAVKVTSGEQLDVMLRDLDIPVEPLSNHAAFLAGQAFAQWIENGGRRGAMLPDLLIGAHAAACNAKILTRDTRRFRTYFPQLILISPESQT